MTVDPPAFHYAFTQRARGEDGYGEQTADDESTFEYLLVAGVVNHLAVVMIVTTVVALVRRAWRYTEDHDLN